MNDLSRQCTFEKLPGNIYEITIQQPTRQAVHDFFQVLRMIYGEAVEKNALPVRTIVHAPLAGPLPVIPLTSELKGWNSDYGKVPSRFVILYEGTFAALVDSLVRNFGRRTSLMRVLKPKYRDQGLEWLVEDRKSADE